jgi:hypothetical protein
MVMKELLNYGKEDTDNFLKEVRTIDYRTRHTTHDLSHDMIVVLYLRHNG